MRNWTGRILVGVAFVIVLALPLLWSRGADDVADTAATLIIISPHNEQIRYETERAFSAWHAAKFGQTVDIDWRNLGGTSDIERILTSQYSALAAEGRHEDGVGMDMVFGGGDFFFDYQLKRGIEFPVLDEHGQPALDETGKPIMQRIPLTEPVEIDAALKAAAYPTPRIADKKLYDPEGHWWGIVLSSFGIVYNRDVLAARDLATPITWSDLAGPRYDGWLALADPSHSGAIKVTYEAILQRYGWERGVQTLRRACANARYFAPGSSKVPIDVSYGDAAAGMCIDFYGRYQSQKIGGGKRVGYVAPADATVITADPIAVLRGARNKELAVRFIEFLLTVEGQAIWNFRRGDPLGPERFELRRTPIRRDMFQLHLARMIDQVDPFTIARPLADGTPSYFSLVPTLLHAMCMDIHGELNAAWSAINNTSDPDTRRRMIAEFDKLPTTDLADIWHELTALKAEPDGRSAREEYRYRLARMDWAMKTLDDAALQQAWDAFVAASPDQSEQARLNVQQIIDATAPDDRRIDFHTVLLTVRRPIWKEYSWAEAEDRRRWTAFFRGQYRRVIDMGS